MGGTLESWRLEELEERWRRREEDIESDRAEVESRMRWNLDRAAVVRLIEASRAARSVRLRLFSSLFCSSSPMKSLRLSSSVWTDPELPPSPSFSVPDPG